MENIYIYIYVFIYIYIYILYVYVVIIYMLTALRFMHTVLRTVPDHTVRYCVRTWAAGHPPGAAELPLIQRSSVGSQEGINSKAN